MVPTHGLTHIALAVESPERALAFYRAAFGVVEAVQSAGGTVTSRGEFVFTRFSPSSPATS